jgi:xanthine dehydrogenase small subunit
VSLCDLSRYPMRHASSLVELCAWLGERHARGERTVLLAGGTDFVVEVKQAPAQAPERSLPLVLDVGRLAELRQIRASAELVSLGAACSFREIAASAAVRERLPLLVRAATDVGGPTIQARGTLGGNLGTASPAADGVAAIAALDATIVVQSVRGERRIAMAELQTGYKQSSRQPDEVIVAIEIRPPAADARWSWRKVGARRAQAIAKVGLAAVAELDGRRVRRFAAAASSVAPVTALMPRTRALLSGAKLGSLSAAQLDAAVDGDVSPIDDLRSTGLYRAHCLRALVRNFARELGALG